jgi:hypothetical protein
MGNAMLMGLALVLVAGSVRAECADDECERWDTVVTRSAPMSRADALVEAAASCDAEDLHCGIEQLARWNYMGNAAVCASTGQVFVGLPADIDDGADWVIDVATPWEHWSCPVVYQAVWVSVDPTAERDCAAEPWLAGCAL